MEQKNQQNGARAKILRALANADCGLTTAELAESAGLTAGQVRDNAGVAKKAGLLTIEQDEMTRFVTYNISQKGRDWLKSGKDDDAQAVADTGQDGEDHQAHYAPEDRGETASAPTGVCPRYSAYMVQGTDSPANQSIVADLDTATAMALRSDDEVIVYGLVEIGRTARKTVFVPA
jgi:hypothetical protein